MLLSRPYILHIVPSVGSGVTLLRSTVGCKYTHALRAKYFGSRVFYFPMAPRLVRPSQDGEPAERLINTLLGAKHGGRHHQQRTSTLTSLRRMIRRCSWPRRSYDNMVSGPKSRYQTLVQVPYSDDARWAVGPLGSTPCEWMQGGNAFVTAAILHH